MWDVIFYLTLLAVKVTKEHTLIVIYYCPCGAKKHKFDQIMNLKHSLEQKGPKLSMLTCQFHVD